MVHSFFKIVVANTGVDVVRIEHKEMPVGFTKGDLISLVNHHVV